MRQQRAMHGGYDRCIRFDDTRAALVPLHGGLATIARHMLAALHLHFGHLFVWQKADNLGNQNPQDYECQRKHAHPNASIP